MIETILNLDEKKRTLEFCFQNLELVVLLARKKLGMETASNAERQKWARILVSAIQAYGRLLEGRELNEILDILEAKGR